MSDWCDGVRWVLSYPLPPSLHKTSVYNVSSNFTQTELTKCCHYPRRLYSRRRAVGRSDASVCLSVCPRSERKTAWAISTKVGRQSVAGPRHALTLKSKGQRSRIQGYQAHPAWVCMSIWLPMFSGFAFQRRSLTGKLSLSHARPAADGWPLMWVSRPL